MPKAGSRPLRCSSWRLATGATGRSSGSPAPAQPHLQLHRQAGLHFHAGRQHHLLLGLRQRGDGELPAPRPHPHREPGRHGHHHAEQLHRHPGPARRSPGPTCPCSFPGQTNVTASGGVAGVLTQEAPADGMTTVTYTFVAANPGTYTYYSGTSMELEVEMGLYGAIIVRPTGFDPNVAANRRAYNTPGLAVRPGVPLPLERDRSHPPPARRAEPVEPSTTTRPFSPTTGW